MTQQNDVRRGIWLMIGASLVFAAQDGLSRHLADTYNVTLVVMLRFWFFALFAIALTARAPGGIRVALNTRQKGLQILRGLLLVTQICVMILSFVLLGLIESHAVATSYPLIVAALSGPILGERVGWRRRLAIGAGFAGVLVILQPGVAVFSPAALIPLGAATMFAIYALLTRYAARQDSTATSFSGPGWSARWP